MSTPGEEKGWTLLLLRKGGLRTFTVSFADITLWGVLGASALVLLAAGAGLGVAWARRHETERVRTLQREVTRLAEERTRILRLAARLDSIERGYRQLRQAMSAEIAPPGGDVELPPAGGEPPEPVAAREGEGYSWPLARRGFVTRSFGEGPGEASGEHRGLDIAAPTGSYVRASRAGRVAGAGRDSVYGLYVRIEHGGRLSTLYGHNDWLFVSAGDSVERDEVVALSGNSGRSTAPHLHFEVREEGEVVDPERVLGRRR